MDQPFPIIGLGTSATLPGSILVQAWFQFAERLTRLSIDLCSFNHYEAPYTIAEAPDFVHQKIMDSTLMAPLVLRKKFQKACVFDFMNP